MSVPGAPPPGGPTGEMPVAAGFDALFQQLTGQALAGALTPGDLGSAGDDADAPDDAEASAVSPEPVAAMPVAVPVVPTPVEWMWTQPAPAPVDGPAGEGTIDGALVTPAPVGDTGLGSLGAAQPVARRGMPSETAAFAPVAAPEGRGETPVAAPDARPGGVNAPSAPAEPVAALPVAMTAASAMTPVEPAEHSEWTVSANPVPTERPTVRPGPVEAGPAAPTDIVATPDVRPGGSTFAPPPDAPGGARSAQARALGEVRQGRARESAPAADFDAPSSPAPVTAELATNDLSIIATPVRRPLPAGAFAAMERLASQPATANAATAAAPVRVDDHGTAVTAPAAATGQSGFQSGDGLGARGRDGGQPAPERAASGFSFRVSDSPAPPAAPLVERAATSDPLAGAAELSQVRELEPALAESVHQQIVRSIRMQWAGGLGEARVSLKPEFLGEVTASINVERGVVTATLHADTPEVRTFIESHAATLRDALVEHGLRLDKLEVAAPEREPQTASDRHQQGRRRQQQEAPPKPRRRDLDATATFDLVSE